LKSKINLLKGLKEKKNKKNGYQIEKKTFTLQIKIE